MKTPNHYSAQFNEQQVTGLAALSATHPTGMAVLSSTLSTATDGWYQLLPAGRFTSRDGRPGNRVEGGHWVLTAEIAQRLIQIAQSRGNKLVIDYEHQTLNAEKNGLPAPAAGWFGAEQIEWREGQGLYIKPDWTNKAQSFLDEGEYLYLSAVFPYNRRGEPLELRMAALTNDPGVTGMEELAALAAQKFITPPPKEKPMNEAVKKVFAKLGITLDNDELSEAQGQAALTALKALQDKATSADEAGTELAALKASALQTVPLATYNSVIEELAVLKATSDQSELSQVISQAKADGKMLAAEESYLSEYGKSAGVAALKAMLEERPVLAALKATQTANKPKPKSGQDNDLNAEELAVLKATGLDKEAFLKARQN